LSPRPERGGRGRPARDRDGGGGPDRGGRRGDGERPSIAVGTTGNQPEAVETIPIGGPPQVALSFGPKTKTDSPLPDLRPGDRLLAFAELELTTDAEDAAHPGRIGNAYRYAPEVEARFVLAGSARAAEGIELAPAWRQAISHRRHHAVVGFAEAELVVPDAAGDHLNVVVSAAHGDARDGDVLLVGQNEKVPKVVQDMAGIRVVRFRPGDAPEPSPERTASCLCAGVPVAKRQTVVLSHELTGLAEGEQLLVRGRLVTDAASLPAPARVSTRLFVADSPAQTEPGGTAASSVTWKGHLSKFTGFNCIPGEGPQTSSKYGVATVRQAPGGSLYVNLVAVSGAPFGGIAADAALPIDTASSELAVTRFRPA
jgi:hypothetical protein